MVHNGTGNWSLGSNHSHSSAIPLINPAYIITSFCGGLPLFGWAVSCLYLHWQCNRQLSTFVSFLLLTDAVQLSLSPALVVGALRKDLCSDDGFRCDLVWYLWLGTSVLGLNLHQLVALEGILSRRYPQCSAQWFSMPCSLLLCFIELVMVTTVVTLKTIHSSIQDHLIGSMECVWWLAAFVISLILCVLFCQSSYPTRHTHCHDKTTERIMLAIAVTTCFILYGLSIPAYMTIDITSIDYNIHMILQSVYISLSSFRLIADPLLCVLACRKPPERKADEHHLTDLR